ncbi:NUDIX hydrolase [Robertkochia aurantiaca]|uniref:NUDIX hydrolase n=1 Tax=Robertkochia aurantiaca TaxID=2873700 RepID=UPI001CCC3B26|nr:CoA pyrophosphatase [Robertkochia sp. 3YJGBD-33]
MKIDAFFELVPKIKNLPLPGQDSHYKMTPSERVEALKNNQYAIEKARRAAVLSLFYPDNNKDTHLLLILRKTYRGVHSNQVGFPGGKVEPQDKDLRQTALRETEEEIGVPEKVVTVFKELSDVYIPPSNFMVTPFMGFTSETPRFIKQEEEVEQIIEVPFQAILQENNLAHATLNTSYATNVKVPSFKLNNYTVWGATAMMLNEVRDLFHKVL